MRTRLVPYVPFGAAKAPLPAALESQIVTPLGELSTANVHYYRGGVNAALLDGVIELGFEYYGQSGWVEPPSCRFLSMASSFDHLEEISTRKYSLIGIGWMLRKAKVWEARGLPVDADGKVQFLSATAGSIMATLIENAKSRGWGAGISIDFDATTASDGQAWGSIITIAYDLDVDLETVLVNLYQQGVCDYRWEGRTLRIFNSDTTMGRDLTTGTNPVRLVVNDGQTSAPEDSTNEDLLTDAMVIGEEGNRWYFTNGTNSPLGRLEQVIAQGGVSDEGTASLLAQPALLAGSETRISYTREFALNRESRVWPFRDYTPGDWVMGQRGVSFERLRTYSLSLTVNTDGVKGHAVLGDRLEDLLTKLAKRTKGITGGTAAGGSGARPAPEGPDRRVPSAPAGLVVQPTSYVDSAGVHQGRVAFDWAHDGKATDGTVQDLDSFQVYYRVNTVGEPWKRLTTVESSSTETSYSPLPLYKDDGVTPEELGFKVRAVGQNDKPSAFSAVVAVTMELDTTAPPKLAAPNVSVALAVYTVESNGLGAAGESMPADYAVSWVEMAPAAAGPWAYIGPINGAGSFPVGGEPYDEPRFFRLIAVDSAGNASIPSDSASGTAVRLVGGDLKDQTIAAGKLQTNEIWADSGWLGRAKISILTTDSITTGMIAVGTEIKTTPGLYKGIYINDTGHFAYNSVGEISFYLDPEFGDVLATGTFRTGTTGARLRIGDRDNIAAIDMWADGTAEHGALYTFKNTEVNTVLGHYTADTTMPTSLQLNANDVFLTAASNAQMYLGLDWSIGNDTSPGGRGRGRIRGTSDALNLYANGASGSNENWMYLRSNEKAQIVGGLNVFDGFNAYGGKNFAMSHPTKPGMELFHASTESPHPGVEYWGEETINDDRYSIVVLPEYFEALTTKEHRAMLVTSNGAPVTWTDIFDGEFMVEGEPGTGFAWLVKAARRGYEFETEQWVTGMRNGGEPEPPKEPDEPKLSPAPLVPKRKTSTAAKGANARTIQEERLNARKPKPTPTPARIRQIDPSRAERLGNRTARSAQ